MGFYLPETMREARRWVLWDGKKIPYQPDGRRASATDRNTWTDYGTVATALKYSDDYKGAGFVFAAGDGLVFIDLDHCINEAGELTAAAQEIIDLFPDTYTEYSQSGEGLHIVARGLLPCSGRRIAGVMEIYSAGRYMAFTGEAYTTAEPAEAQAAINELCRRYNITEAPEIATATPTATTAEDAAIIRQCGAGRSGADFSALWAGDWSKYKAQGKSQSEADYRLLEILYYYSGDAEQVARLFLQCPLGQRDKAQRSDYIPRTINAIAAKKRPQTSRQSATGRGKRRANLTDTPDSKKKYRQF